jgi:hypothetical protein
VAQGAVQGTEQASSSSSSDGGSNRGSSIDSRTVLGSAGVQQWSDVLCLDSM